MFHGGEGLSDIWGLSLLAHVWRHCIQSVAQRLTRFSVIGGARNFHLGV